MYLLFLFLAIFIIAMFCAIYFYQQLVNQKEMHKNLQDENNKLKQEIDVVHQNASVKVNEQKLTSIFKHLPIGLILTDEKAQVLYLNPQAEIFLGISFSQLLNKNLGQLIKFLDTNHKEFSDTNLIAEYQNWQIPNKLEFKTVAKSSWLQTKLVQYEIEGAYYCLWVLGSLHETNEQVLKMQSFYSQAAHDLKTPISIIKSAIELLLLDSNKIPPDKQKELIIDTKTQIELLQSLVEDILNVARLEQSKIQPSLKPVLVSKIILTSIKKHETLFKKKSLGMEFNTADLSGMKVMADAYLLQTIIDNLISNAIKYTFTGSITISIVKENSHIFINVTDTGVGIDKEQQRLLFKIYQQVGEARKLPTEKSTGLGLFIAKEMARLMNGEVTLTVSEPGRGSTFTLKLPAA